MNLYACRVVLRPRGPLESLDLTLRFLRANGRVWMRLVALLIAPFVPLVVGLCWWSEGSLALLALPLAVAPLLQAPATALGGEQLFADGIRVRDGLRSWLRSPFGLFVIWLTWVGSWVVTAGVLAWIVAVPLAWVTEAVVLERVGAAGGLFRSLRLLRHHLGLSLAAVFGWYLVTGWGAVAGEALGQGLVRDLLQFGTPFGDATQGVVTPYVLLGMLVVQPIYGAYRLMLYLDLRTRAEVWDLQVALRAVGLAARGDVG